MFSHISCRHNYGTEMISISAAVEKMPVLQGR
jgi:hypothetical protein